MAAARLAGVGLLAAVPCESGIVYATADGILQTVVNSQGWRRPCLASATKGRAALACSSMLWFFASLRRGAVPEAGQVHSFDIFRGGVMQRIFGFVPQLLRWAWSSRMAALQL